jgi:hypothetical protein
MKLSTNEDFNKAYSFYDTLDIILLKAEPAGRPTVPAFDFHRTTVGSWPSDDLPGVTFRTTQPIVNGNSIRLFGGRH